MGFFSANILSKLKHAVLFILLLSLVLTPLLSSASPVFAATGINKQIGYQGVLRNSSGNAVPNASYDIVFKIYNVSSGGTPLWTGTYTASNGNPVATNNGFFHVLLGSGTGNTMTVDFTQDEYYLGMAVGSDSEMTPRQRIASVPQAFNADKLNGLGSTALIVSGDVSGTLGATSILSATGTTRGLLTSADWTTFNNKLGTTLNSGLVWVGNGSSTATAVALFGDASISNAGVVTIGSGAITSAKILDGAIVDADVNASAAIALSKLASGSNIITSLTAPSGSSANGGSIAANVLTLALADGTNPGLLSTGAQTIAGSKTFSSAPTLSSMTAGSVLFAGVGGLVSQNNAGLFWDNTNSRLGIGTANPTAALEITPSGAIASQWTLRSGAGFLGFKSVAYGTGIFVAVADTNALSTSPDGITWTQRSVPSASIWRSVTYSNGTFVAVGSVGGTGTVMTSPDGITWTNRTPAANNDWYSVTYGNALFVAVATSGTGNRVMTSPDGITWTARTSASDDMWRSVTYGNGLFVAVSYVGSTYRVMTSPDGIAWTGRSATNGAWNSVTYGGGLFVAVAESSPYVMTSPDGITWTNRTPAANNAWTSVAYGNGVFVAVSNTGTGNRVMTSSDGITWTSRTSAADNGWRGVVFGNNFFVAVADAEVTSNQRVMTSSGAIPTVIAANGSITTSGNLTVSGNGSFGGTLNVTGASTLATATANSLTLSPITQGSLLFAGAGGLVSQNNAGLFWDNTNSRLGIGTTTPSSTLGVNGTLSVSGTTASSTISVTGGTVTTSGAYTIHTFTGSGTFTVSSGTLNVDYLVVAGGGGGSSATAGTDADGSGGGAGGFLTASTTASGATTVTVGAGGAGGTTFGTSPAPGTAVADGTNGASSSFGSITASGGGGGGSRERAGRNGASGGGAGISGTSLSGGTATPAGQGNNGGANGGGPNYGGGGGGGAGAVGQAGSTTKGGDGGAGLASSISGTSQTYAGGGGSGRFGGGGTPGVGGTGGGGNLGAAGAANTGGAGGGAVMGSATGFAGGSGIFIVRYLTSALTIPGTPFTSIATDGTGRVGIGTSAPTAQLHTTGTVRFQNFGAGTLTTDASGNVTVSSDVRIKDVQSGFTRGLADLKGLTPINYNWTEASGLDTQHTYTGFAAQNVLEFIPEAVSESNGLLTLSDRPILAAAVNAIKELDNKTSIQGLQIGKVAGLIGVTQKDLDAIRDEYLSGVKAEQDARFAQIEAQWKALREEYQKQIASNSAESTSSANTTADSANSLNLAEKPLNELEKKGAISYYENITIHGESIFEKLAIFIGDVFFKGRVIFEDKDVAGEAEILAGDTEVIVTFERAYTIKPLVNATIVDAGAYSGGFSVADVTQKGFAIRLTKSYDKDILFNWATVAVKDAKLYKSVGKSSVPSTTPSPSPTASETPAASSTPTPMPTGTTQPEPTPTPTETTKVTVSPAPVEPTPTMTP